MPCDGQVKLRWCKVCFFTLLVSQPKSELPSLRRVWSAVWHRSTGFLWAVCSEGSWWAVHSEVGVAWEGRSDEDDIACNLDGGFSSVVCVGLAGSQVSRVPYLLGVLKRFLSVFPYINRATLYYFSNETEPSGTRLKNDILWYYKCRKWNKTKSYQTSDKPIRTGCKGWLPHCSGMEASQVWVVMKTYGLSLWSLWREDC